MKKRIFHLCFTAFIFSFVLGACSDEDDFEASFQPNDEYQESEDEGNDTQQGTEDSSSSYNEQYRPLIHYTPAANWINDPNGMVYADGIYHLFYQYNPYGNDWGNMSWGHATSTDLIKWEEQDVALVPDDLGDIYSGSAVYDKDNTAGFGQGAIVAIYTSAGTYQQQSIAYSTDGGMTFTKYSGNPVIANSSEPDFRDPKVFYHEESGNWVMVLAKGSKYGIDIWTSPNLKTWTYQSTFSTDIASCNRGIWECPDLIRMDYNGAEKWVLIVNVNPGGPVSGSGTQYFVGSFDGNSFVADDLDYPMWLDYGTDNYAGVTWSNVEDRAILIGWMNNWNYAGSVPATPWRSAMTLPRELKLIEFDGEPLLANTVVEEIETIAGDWEDVNSSGSLGVSGPYQLRLNLDLGSNGTFSIYNSSGEYLEMQVNSSNKKLITRRNGNTGDTSFSSLFSIPSISTPFNCSEDSVTIDIFVDQSSVEIFTEDGSMAQTTLVFPESIYDQITVSDVVLSAKVRQLENIWK